MIVAGIKGNIIMVNFLDQVEKNKKKQLSKKQKEIKNIIVFEIALILLLLIQSWFFKVAIGVDTGSELYDWLIVFLCAFPILGYVTLGLLLAVQNFIALYKWKFKYIRIINICSFVMYLSVSIIFLFQHEYRLFWFPVMAYSILVIILALYSIRNKISENNRVAVLGIIVSTFFIAFIVFGAIWG